MLQEHLGHADKSASPLTTPRLALTSAHGRHLLFLAHVQHASERRCDRGSLASQRVFGCGVTGAVLCRARARAEGSHRRGRSQRGERSLPSLAFATRPCLSALDLLSPPAARTPTPSNTLHTLGADARRARARRRRTTARRTGRRQAWTGCAWNWTTSWPATARSTSRKALRSGTFRRFGSSCLGAAECLRAVAGSRVGRVPWGVDAGVCWRRAVPEVGGCCSEECTSAAARAAPCSVHVSGRASRRCGQSLGGTRSRAAPAPPAPLLPATTHPAPATPPQNTRKAKSIKPNRAIV
eukprot:659291-Rhodomonas_salina.4